MNIEVYTDGSATQKHLPGGYGWVLVIHGTKHSEGNGHIPQATNNDAELEAAIHGLAAALKEIDRRALLWAQSGGDDNFRNRIEVTLVSDSQITLNWANGTYKFKQESKYARFAILKSLMMRLNAKTRWVQGHSGDEHNERCDVLANEGRVGPKPIKPPKKPNVKNRLFRWDEIRECYIRNEDGTKTTYLVSDKKLAHNSAGLKYEDALASITRVVVELMQLEEKRKK